MPCGYCGGPKKCNACDCADARMYRQLNLKGGAAQWPRARLLQQASGQRGANEQKPEPAAPAPQEAHLDVSDRTSAPARAAADDMRSELLGHTCAAAGACYIVFDFETTGLGKTEHIRIVQVGARALDASLRPVDQFTSLVNPTIRIQRGAIEVHGISDERVASEETWAVIGLRLNQWMSRVRGTADGALTLLAHNGKRYDSRVLVFEHARHGLSLPPNLHHADTLDIFKRTFPGRPSYKLGEMHEGILGCELENAHDAMADVDGVCALLRRAGAEEAAAAAEACSEALEAIVKRCGVALPPAPAAAAA